MDFGEGRANGLGVGRPGRLREACGLIDERFDLGEEAPTVDLGHVEAFHQLRNAAGGLAESLGAGRDAREDFPLPNTVQRRGLISQLLRPEGARLAVQLRH